MFGGDRAHGSGPKKKFMFQECSRHVLGDYFYVSYPEIFEIESLPFAQKIRFVM